MEIVLEIAEEKGIDPFSAGKMLSASLREMIESDAKRMNFRTARKSNSLPLD
jgi:hypothetical protein